MNPKKPICIAAPVRRSGTTLLQRLLCSATNALIYGETCANDFQSMAGMYANKEPFMNHAKDWRNDQLKKVLNGEVNDWIPDLMPDIDYYLKSYKNIIQVLIDTYGGFAKEQGKEVWGMKFPEWNPASLKYLQELLPGTKIIYLHRNLSDCVRSAKRIEMLINESEINQFCHIWRQYTDYAREQITGENVLHVEYEKLIANPEEWIKAIEDFTGAKNIQASVLAVKVNTYSNDQRLKSNESYLQPAELTESEQELVAKYEKKSIES